MASPETVTCLVGRKCNGNETVIAVDKLARGYEVVRYGPQRSEKSAVVPGPELDGLFSEMAKNCLVFKVGDGYSQVLLQLDSQARVRDISPVLIQG